MSKHRNLVFILALLIALGPLSVDMYLPAFPLIARDFHVAISQVELSLASFFIGLSLGQLLYGPLSDRFGRKFSLYIGLSLYIISSIACALAPNMESLIIFRFFQALGGCAGMVISRAMVRDLFSNRQESAQVFSTLVLIMGLAPILSPLIGGQILLLANWHALFWTTTAVAALGLVIMALKLPETHAADPSVKLLSSWRTYHALTKDQEFMQNTLANSLAQGGMFAYITGSPFVFIHLYGVSSQAYGLFFGANAFGLIFFSQLNARFIRRTSSAIILKRALMATALFGVSLLAVVGLHGSFGAMAFCLFGYVSSLGFVFPNTSAGALAGQGQRAGAASALMGTIQFMFATIISSTVSFLHAESAFPMAALVALCGSSGLVAYLMIKPKHIV